MTKLTNFIKRHEGYRSLPYLDTVGKWTWGYGRNIDDVPFTGDEVKALFNTLKIALDNSDDETKELIEKAILEAADESLENDLSYATSACQRVFNDFEIYTNNRRISLISIMFNLGNYKFLGFKKMITAVRGREWRTAHDELLDSKRAKQLPKRSQEEASMLEIG